MRGGRGGGVAFYINRDTRVRFEKHVDAGIEQMWLSLQSNGYKIFVGTAYRPPWMSVDFFADAVLDTITAFPNYDYLVLLGDFNVNMLDSSNINVTKINNLLQYLDLKQVVCEPTHLSVNAHTLIDLVCTNCKIRDVTVSNITGSLGHAMINVQILFKKIKLPPTVLQYRPLKRIDIQNFNKDLSAINWDSISSSNLECMVENFNLNLLHLLDKHAPLISVKIKHTQNLPWVTDNIKFMISLRNDAHNVYSRSKSDIHKKYYKDLKKLVEVSINNEKRAYFNHFINSNADNSKVFWKNVKEKILPNSRKCESLPDCLNDANAINDHFLKLPCQDEVNFSEISFFECRRFKNEVPPLKLHPINESDVAKYILSLKSNAMGSDSISRDMVLLTLPQSLSAITNMVNLSITSGVVPSQWKKALITPLAKVDHPCEYKDLRPISILPFLSKLLEKAVYNQVIKYVEINGLLPSLQSGFRRGRSTVTALLDVTDNILTDQDDGRGTLLALLDFSRAFDSLSVPLLLSKLSYYGFDNHTVKWFHSYLSDRYQSVRLRKQDGSYLTSPPKLVTRGVPQGSILGPLLFIIYSADLPSVVKHCKYHCYADDVQLYISVNPSKVTEAAQALNEDLDGIVSWSAKNCLNLNPSKSKLMVLGTKLQTEKILQNMPVVRVLNTDLEFVSEARNLGIVFDSQLRFEAHVLSLVKSCFYRLKILYKIRKYLTEKSRITLCESLILSRLNYGDLVYGPRLINKTKQMLQRVQNACCRFCFNVPPRSHVSPFLNNASMLNMGSRRRSHLATLLFDLLKFKHPDYLYKKLKFPTFQNRYGAGVPRALRPPLSYNAHKTVAFTGSFRHQATKCWNDIPPPVRESTSKFVFKNKIKAFLMEGQKSGTVA